MFNRTLGYDLIKYLQVKYKQTGELDEITEKQRTAG